MIRAPLVMPATLMALLVGVTGVAGCKIVKTAEPGSQAADTASATPANDAERMGQLAGQMFTDRVVPYVAEQAMDLADLRASLAGGLDAAGDAHGHRPGSEGSPWNFLVKGQGKVIAADTASRAATLDLDTDADGAADLTVQLGPVVKGTALRDSADFIVFSDFRDQIEFAKLARALNDEAHRAIIATQPTGGPVGKTMAFEGALTIRGANDALVLVPTQLNEVP